MVFSLSDANEKYYYEALSHYWGTDGANCEIKIHELTKDRPRTIKNVVDRAKPRKFYIRPNLHAALSQLRDKDQSINLWVDALCIDQDDEREKNQQVSIMAKIYSGAHRVCIWLGAGNNKCQQAMDFIEEIIDLPSLDTYPRRINRDQVGCISGADAMPLVQSSVGRSGTCFCDGSYLTL